MKDLLAIGDLSIEEVERILALAAQVKREPRRYAHALAGKQIVLLFEKPSLRTRLTFELGIRRLGGGSLFVDQKGRIEERESLADVARTVERWTDGLVLRTFEHRTVTEIAASAQIPVVNGLSDWEHPCQALADYLTLRETLGDLRHVKLAYVGDGNNVSHSLVLTAAALGSAIAVATPPGYEMDPAILKAAQAMAKQTGARIETTHDPAVAVEKSHAVYTDVWASMGQESEAAERQKIFAGYQISSALIERAAPNALFLHCLPAHRGQEVGAEVIDSSRSVVFDQAENRLYAEQAVLLLLLGENHG